MEEKEKKEKKKKKKKFLGFKCNTTRVIQYPVAEVNFCANAVLVAPCDYVLVLHHF